MAIQTQQFRPLQFQHYQLAETQAEKDAAASRQANLIAQQGLNALASANAHAAGQIALQGPRLAEEARQADMRDAQQQASLDATVNQQAVQNDLAQQGVDLRSQELDQKARMDAATIARQGVMDQLAQKQESRMQQQDQRAQNEEFRKATTFEQEQADRKLANEQKEIPVALAKFGNYLNTAEPDKNGMVDVTDQKDNIKTMVGGFGGQDYKKIFAQNVDGKTKLIGVPDSSNVDFGYGKRPDGTNKGGGFLGELKRPDGGVMTEYSVGVDIGGKNMDIPTLVPTLSKQEINTLLNLKDGEAPPDSIINKAADFAEKRIKEGKPVFATAEEVPGYSLSPVPLTRNGNQVSIDNKVLQSAALFGQGKSQKEAADAAKAAAELEQTNIENKTKQAELDYMVKNGVKMGAADKDNKQYETKIVPDQLGGSMINQVGRDGSVISTPVGMDGKVGTPIRIAPPSAMQQQQSQSALPPGTKRVINGTPAVWDGRGWKAEK